MRKLKFKIDGRHCESCAVLIEEKLKNQTGVISVKVSLDSQKGAVLYDEKKIDESDILRLIKETGDFRVEKVETKKENEAACDKESAKTNEGAYVSSRTSFFLGVLSVVVVVAIIGNIILGMMFYNRSAVGLVKGAQNQAPSALGNNPQPAAPSGAGNPAALQTFQITKQDNVRGNFDAPITLVEFSDFECPFCARVSPTLQKILTDYQGKVRLVYKYFPLSFHPNSQKASEAAQCAAEQGKFWEYHDRLFANQVGGFSVDKFKAWAGDLGLNTKKFNDCLDTNKYASQVAAELNEGQQKGVSGTPATFINGQLVSGAQPYEAFKQIIDSLLSN